MVFDPESLGFTPGTLIQTLDDGHLPIEQIRVGMLVLAQPEAGGERAYRQVLNTVAHLDQEVYAVQVKVAGADSLTTLFATGGHPFWVEAPLVDSEHWMATECLEPGFVLQLADGSKATVYAAGLIRQTQFPEIGFAADERAGVGIVLDLSARQAKLASDAVALKLGRLEVGEPWLSPVYNFEVEEFHTYYVGEVGVWARNTNCMNAEAASSVIDKVELKQRCFDGETPVLVREEIAATGEEVLSWREMWHVKLGSEVLSRCEITGELGYKKVVKVFQHEHAEVFDVWYDCGSEYRARRERNPLPILATAEHPFFTQNGWTEVQDLQPGDEFLTHDGVRATVIRVEKASYRIEVYNLEVEDFHTYFVGWEGVWVHNKQLGWAE